MAGTSQKAASLRDILKNLTATKKQLDTLISILSLDDVLVIFDGNPVCQEGSKLNPQFETPESYATDRYIHCMDLLTQTQMELVKAQERLLRLGVHHVRLEVGENIS